MIHEVIGDDVTKKEIAKHDLTIVVVMFATSHLFSKDRLVFTT